MGLKEFAKADRARFEKPRKAAQATPNPRAAKELNRRIRDYESTISGSRVNATAYTRPGSMKG